MTTTAQTEIGKIPGGSKNYSYPQNIAGIPFASFLRIYKYEYEEGMATVGAAQNDAIGAFQGSGLMKSVTDGLGDTAQWAYGDKTGGGEYLALTEDKMIAKFKSDTREKHKPQMGGATRKWEDNRTKEDMMNETFEVSNGWGTEPTTTTLNELLGKKNDAKNFHDQGYQKHYCNLAMPNEFQYNYGANWNNTFKLGTLALAADDPARAAMVLGAGGALGGVTSLVGSNLGKSESGAALFTKGAKDGVEKAGNLFGVNSNILDPTNIVGLAGLAPNENAIQFFKKMEFRQFDLNFEFAARSDTESKEIQEIITWFKLGMHPVSKQANGGGSGVLLGFPDVWRIEPRFIPGNATGGKFEPGTDKPHPMMPQTKLCALTSMSVNTTPMGQFSTVYDGSIPLITVTLKFEELSALTRADFMTNEYL